MILTAGAIEAVCRLVTTILEGIPVEQRRATALSWFWMWWPVTKRFLNKEQQEQIERIMQEPAKP